jgi:hypothetical protein
MTKHTPGLWVVRDCGKHPPGHEAWKSCAHLADENGQAIPKTFPNMQLQAAAPDLLAACEAFLDAEHIALTDGQRAFSKYVDAIDAAKAAISKARGQ